MVSPMTRILLRTTRGLRYLHEYGTDSELQRGEVVKEYHEDNVWISGVNILEGSVELLRVQWGE